MLAGTVPLFLGALVSDYAYWSSYQVEWGNFASWLIVGGLLFGAVALVCALTGMFGASPRRARAGLYLFLLAATWALGFVNALVHARDAWAIMPTALLLSVLVAVLACVTTWMGFSSLRGGAK